MGGAAMMNLLSVVLGMLLVFLIFAMAVSHLREFIAQRLSDRGRFLREGIYRLISDDAIAARVLHHALISGVYRDPSTRTAPPSYIEPATFALALSHIIVRRGAPATATSSATGDGDRPQQPVTEALTYESLRSALLRFADRQSQLSIALLPIVDRAAGDLQAAQKGIEEWFASGMDRVSGWYKGHARNQLFWIGMLVAAALNIDAIEVFRHLNRSPEQAARLASLAEQVERTGKLGNVDVKEIAATRTASSQEIQSLTAMIQDHSTWGTLPIGYACLGVAKDAAARHSNEATPATLPPSKGAAAKGLSASLASCQEEIGKLSELSAQQWILKLLGWILTAFAGSMGAAYWFAAISKVVNVRAAGPRPESAKTK